MGIPFLHPWANRLGSERFELAGRAVDLGLEGLHLKRDGAGLPMHGLLTAARGWRVERHLETDDGGVLVASFDFGAYPRLLEAFPFPHRVEIEATCGAGVGDCDDAAGGGGAGRCRSPSVSIPTSVCRGWSGANGS